jgi:hypothetical protein
MTVATMVVTTMVVTTMVVTTTVVTTTVATTTVVTTTTVKTLTMVPLTHMIMAANSTPIIKNGVMIPTQLMRLLDSIQWKCAAHAVMEITEMTQLLMRMVSVRTTQLTKIHMASVVITTPRIQNGAM